jgi:DNA-binding response OmpR family regulator
MSNNTILLVDADEEFINETKPMLESVGYKVEVSYGMDTAESMCSDIKPDLAIVGLMMDEPDSGFTLSYRFKKCCPEMPIIMVSGVTGKTGHIFDATTDEEKSWIKADKFMAKPVRFEDLNKNIEKVLN